MADKYNPLDPFFIVNCRNCNARYWSTRRMNIKCSKCGSEKVVTSVPEHEVEDMKGYGEEKN